MPAFQINQMELYESVQTRDGSGSNIHSSDAYELEELKEEDDNEKDSPKDNENK